MEILDIIWQKLTDTPIGERDHSEFDLLARKFSKVLWEYEFFKNRDTKKEYNILVFHSVRENEEEKSRDVVAICRGLDFASFLYHEELDERGSKINFHFIEVTKKELLEEALNRDNIESADAIFFWQMRSS